MVTVPEKITNGPWNGVNPPIFPSGKIYIPPQLITTSLTHTTTATRLYYVPFYVPRTTTFAGAKTYNQGAGDNGETLRIGMYAEAAAGGPGALLKDFGEITLTAAAALRTLASSVTVVGARWVYLCLHANSAMAMYSMTPRTSGAGTEPSFAAPLSFAFGTYNLNATALYYNSTPACDYVDTAYGALAATAVAPTATLYAAGGAEMPVFSLYV